MVNVKHRQCGRQGCATRPAFNFPGEPKGAFCNKHKEAGMINVDRKEPAEGGARRQAAACESVPRPHVRCSCAAAPAAPSPWRGWCRPPCPGSQQRS
jgi:hypothetical protein